MRKMKKALAVAMSAVMAAGMSLTAFAAEQKVSVDAPIYAYDITNVVVPTNFVVAFNPNGLDVEKESGTVVQDQIVSKNYGIINKSTKDKIITVTLDVEDLNEDKIQFVADATDASAVAADDYAVTLQVVPANDTAEVKVGSNSADLNTTGADLANVVMTGATSNAKTLAAGENDVDFLLTKADYTGKIDLNTATENNVTSDFTLSALAAGGKGITAFTFSGTMNASADWTQLTKGIRITAVYGSENAPSGATAVTNTGALYDNPNPVFKTGKDVGTIKYKVGTGTDALASITKIEMDYTGVLFDIYNERPGDWTAATDENGLVTIGAGAIAIYAGYYTSDETREVIITYETVNGDTKTATVDVRLREPINVAPSFSTGSAVGTISYESGTGDDALVSITKIEMDYAGNLFDVYNVRSGDWAAATDVNGLVTIDGGAIGIYAAQYSTREAIITYETVGGETKTATVDVKMQ